MTKPKVGDKVTYRDATWGHPFWTIQSIQGSSVHLIDTQGYTGLLFLWDFEKDWVVIPISGIDRVLDEI